MSKTNDTSKLATLEDHGTLADTELDAVTGGSGDIKGESTDSDHKDWSIGGFASGGPGDAWNQLLRNYGY
jgi:hypothetical protein